MNSYDYKSCWDKGEKHDREYYDGDHPEQWICRKCLMLGADIPSA